MLRRDQDAFRPGGPAGLNAGRWRLVSGFDCKEAEMNSPFNLGWRQRCRRPVKSPSLQTLTAGENRSKRTILLLIDFASSF